ncbi:MAG TPA: hypothetical protein DCX06_08810 [Opitutae bacterium]|nr:hypothetical protein [Opitutae bacterium]
MIARRTPFIVLSLITLALLSGCASYKLGSQARLPFETIYIRPASNDSFAPQSQALISAQIREAFIRDGRVRLLTNEKEADAVLEVTLTDYDRESGARLSSDTVSARTFRLQLEAEITLYNSESGDFYFEGRKIDEQTSVYADNPYNAASIQSYNQAEYNAMNRLARDIARQIADEVLSPWPTREEEAVAKQAAAKETETVTE